MKKILVIFFIFCITIAPGFAWGKKVKVTLTLTDSFEKLNDLNTEYFFKINTKIFFSVNNPNGFSSDYIRYQIVKQDEKAHIGGYTRIRNILCRVKNKNLYTDYFVLSEKGKYFIQVFDITNLQQWLAIQGFQVVED